MIKTIWPYTKGYRFKSILAALTIIGEVLVEVSIPYMMADIVNIGIENKDTAFIIQRGIMMILMAIASLSLGALSARFASVSSAGFAKNLRGGLFERVQSFSFANVDRFSTASLITRLTTDVNTIQNTYMMAVRTFIRAPFMLIAATVMAVRISPNLALVFLFALPILALIIGVLMSKTFPRFKAMLAKFDAMNANVQENLTAIRVVKAFVRGDYEDERFTFSANEVKDYQVKAEKLLVVAMPLAQYMAYICMIAVCYLGGVQIVEGRLQSGDLISFISYIGQVLSAVMMVAMMMVMLVMSKASMARITEVLAEKPSINDDDAKDIAVTDGSIEFDDVSFSYNGNPDNPNLEHIKLKIASGETIGIIGGTGSGKSVVSKSLAAAGAVVIDADKIAHEIILKGEPAYQEIVKYYGTGILDAKGNIIRRRLGEIVFHDAEKLAFLNQCTHKYICAEVDRQIAKAEKENTARAVILDAPLLLEAGLESRCDTVWVVYADPEVRAKRVMARDGVSYDLAKARIANQKSWEEYKESASVVIDNSKELAYLQGQLDEILKTI